MTIKFFKSTLFAFTLAITGIAQASIITVDHNILLPTSGVQNIDLDSDGLLDIGMAENFRGGDSAFLTLGVASGPTEMVEGFVAEGTLIDDSLSRLAFGFQTPRMTIGDNYLGIFNASRGAFFGFATIDYDGTNMVLASFTYDDSGAAITATNATEVPVPANILLMVLGLVGLGFNRFKNR